MSFRRQPFQEFPQARQSVFGRVRLAFLDLGLSVRVEN
jgi:hypothetical protein